MNPTVSVIIPVYNRRVLLPRALDSVLKQTLPPQEILVVDDGSTDEAAGFLAQAYPQTLCLRQENRGPAAARNTGIRAASSEWLAFLDSDDEWLPEKLQMQMEYLRMHPDCRIMQTEEIWVRSGKRVNPMNKHRKAGGRIFEKCLPLCLISPSAVILHRSLFEECGFFDESFPVCEDYELWLRLTSRHWTGYVEKPGIIKYGGHEDQLSRRLPAMDRYRIRALLKVLRSGILDPGQSKAALEMLKEKIRIYNAGALKRGKAEQAARFESLLNELHRPGLEEDLKQWMEEDNETIPASTHLY